MTTFAITIYAIAAIFAAMMIPPLIHLWQIAQLWRHEGIEAVARLSPNHRDDDETRA